MRKHKLTLGIILLFIGVIAASSSNWPIRRLVYDKVAAGEKVWEVSGFLNEGDIMLVDLTAGETWWQYFVRAPAPDYSEPLNVTIVGPSGDQTTFNVSIGSLLQGDPLQAAEMIGQGLEIPVGVLNVELASQVGDDLELRGGIREIGGIIKRTGEYLAQVEQTEFRWEDSGNPTIVYWPKTPPETLNLLKEIYAKEYPYTFLLFIGVPLIVSGFAVSTWGAKSRKYGKQVKRKSKS